MIKRLIKLALLTFVPVVWWFYQAVGYGLCWAGYGLQIIALGLFNVLFVIPEQTTCQLLARACHWELPVWQCVAIPSLLDFNANSGWVVGLAIVTWLVTVITVWSTHDFGIDL